MIDDQNVRSLTGRWREECYRKARREAVRRLNRLSHDERALLDSPSYQRRLSSELDQLQAEILAAFGSAGDGKND